MRDYWIAASNLVRQWWRCHIRGQHELGNIYVTGAWRTVILTEQRCKHCKYSKKAVGIDPAG